MPIHPVDRPAPYDLANPADVRKVALSFACGLTLHEVAEDLGMDEASVLIAFGTAVDNFLGLMINTVTPPPEGGALVVSGEGLDQAEMDELRSEFEQALPEGTNLIVSNFGIETQVVGPLADDQALIVTGEDLDGAMLEELRDQFDLAFGGLSMIVANFPIDVRTMTPSQLTALREDCDDILAAPPNEVYSCILPEPDTAFSRLTDLADRYKNAMRQLNGPPVQDSDLKIEVVLTSVGDKWKLYFVEKLDAGDNTLHAWTDKSVEALLEWATATVLGIESAAGMTPPTA